MSKTITWLHISDLHAGKPKRAWDMNRVIETLVKDFAKLEHEQGLRPDLIFFTGDAAFGQLGSGTGQTIAEQLELANSFFEKVRGTYKPKSERIGSSWFPATTMSTAAR